MRAAAAVVLVAGCAAAEPRPLRQAEVRAAGAELAGALERVRVEGRPSLRVVAGAPEALLEEARRRVMESGKFALSETERDPAYVIEAEVGEAAVAFSIVERATHRRVECAIWTRPK